MKNLIRAFALLTTVALGWLFISGPSAEGPASRPSQWGPYTGPPPLDWDLNPAEVYYRNIAGGVWNVAVSSDAPASKTSVSIDWTNRVNDQLTRTTFATSYWVTALALDDDGLGFLVAGKRRNGNTLIDHYRYSVPGGGVVPIGGSTSSSVSVSITNLYDSAQEGKDIVCAMEYVAQSSDAKVLMQFYDSKNIYTGDILSGSLAMHLLASPDSSSAAPFIVPELSNKASLFVETYLSSSVGIYYLFKSRAFCQGTNVLVDSDSDASIDSVEWVHHLNWYDSPYNDGASVLPW